jgi:hypothetical protein
MGFTACSTRSFDVPVTKRSRITYDRIGLDGEYAVPAC